MKKPPGSTTREAQSILRATFNNASETALWPVSATTSNFVYQTSDGCIVRFPQNDWVSEAFFRERKLLNQLKDRLGVSIPQVIHFNEQPVFMTYRAIEGMVASRDAVSTLNSKCRERFGAGLGAFIARLHSQTADQFNFLPRDYSEELLRRLRQNASQIGKRDPEGKVGHLILETLEAWEEVRNRNGKLVLLHQDLHGQNLICNHETGELVGVLDFTLAWIGDPLWDFPEVYRCGADILEHALAVYKEMRGYEINIEAIKIISRLQLLRSFDRAPLNSAREAQVLERIRAHP